jgi:hypothetical protein
VEDSLEPSVPPSDPPDINPRTTPADADAEAKKPQQLVTASTAQQIPKASSGHTAQAQVPQSPPVADLNAPPTAADPGAKEPQAVTESGVQPDPDLSEKLWNDAYESIKKDEDKLFEAYRNTLAEVLVNEKLKDLKAKKSTDTSDAGVSDLLAKPKDLKAEILDQLKDLRAQRAMDTSTGASDVSAEREVLKAKILDELKDRTKRQMHMKMLVEIGKAQFAKASKITKAVGDFAKAILLIKPIIDPVIQYTPQTAPAALPWAGVCFGLQVSSYYCIVFVSLPADIPQILSNPMGATESNLAGITHVVSRMEWYCALTEHLLNEKNIMVGKESFEAVLEQLTKAVITLYKALLLYQMKSVCSYYRNQGLVFLRALVNLDNWDGDLKSVTDAEDAILRDSGQYYKEYETSALRQSVDSGKKMVDLLGDIRQDFRQFISLQKDFISLEKDFRQNDIERSCRRDLYAVDPQDDIDYRIERDKDKILEVAYEWIFDTQEYAAFTNWDDSGPDFPSNRLLWIRGLAGTGKTMLMIGIIRKLSSQPVVLAPELSFFFCRGGDADRNNATAVLRSLIWLLLIQQPRLISHLLQDYENLGANLFKGETAFYKLSDAFRKMLIDPKLSSVYLAVDALDECEDGQLELIDLIRTSLTLSGSRVKWLVSSRPDVKLKSTQTTLLELDERSLKRPVNAYIVHKLHALNDLKGYNEDTLAELSSEIRQRAMNTFLWVALVFKELASVDRSDAVGIVKKIPSGLSKVYGHIMTKIEHENKDDQSRCKDVLVALSLAYRPLSRFELAVASVGSDVDLTRIIEKCRSFLTIKENTVYLIHQSARDYLKENFESRLQNGGVVQGHANICKRSIAAMSILKRNIHTLEDYGPKPKDLRPPNPDPLVPIRYSCLFWVDHLCDANSQSLDFKKELADDRKMWDFFDDHLCDEDGLSLNLKKELTDNGARWKFFNDHIANFQSLNKQLVDGGAVWEFFNSHLYDPGRSLDFEKELATGGAVWKFFNDHLVNSQSPDFKRMLADGGAVWRFFNNHFLHWLESLSLLGELPASVRSIRKLFTQVCLYHL